MLLNQQQHTQTLSIVIKLVSIFAFVRSCASQPNFDFFRQVHLSTTNPLRHDRAHESIRVSRTVTGDFLFCRSTPYLEKTRTSAKPECALAYWPL